VNVDIFEAGLLEYNPLAGDATDVEVEDLGASDYEQVLTDLEDVVSQSLIARALFLGAAVDGRAFDDIISDFLAEGGRLDVLEMCALEAGVFMTHVQPSQSLHILIDVVATRFLIMDSRWIE